MGRIRTIKPEFPHSESIGRLTRDARLLFIQLWTLVDDSGRTRGGSRLIASLLYPYDPDAPMLMEGWLSELESAGHIRRYQAEGDSYLEIVNFLKHQKIDKPTPSKLPRFPEDSPSTPRTLAKNSLGREGIKEGIKERKGGEQERALDEKLAQPVNPETSDGSELAAANWLCAEANLPLSMGTRQQVALSLRCLANEGGTMETASQFMLQAVTAARERGEKINRFWFEEERYKPQAATAGSVPSQPTQAGYERAAEINAAGELRAYEMWLGMNDAFRAANPMAAPAGWQEAKPA